MKSLIVPMVGKSTRFPNLRPKWMLTHPMSGFMGTESIKGLNSDEFSTIYFVIQKAHEDEYQIAQCLIDEFKHLTQDVQVVLLDNETESQPETVYECIKKMNIIGPILVKDSDNYFEANTDINDNYVCYFDLNDKDELNARNKSYIQFDANGFISNIVEKKIVSSTFSVGGYGFLSAEEFCDCFEHVRNNSSSPLYMSNIIFDMLLNGIKFKGIKTEQYEDWGTIEEWNRYKKTFKVLFLDLDGVLIKNTSPHTQPLTGTGLPLQKNIKLIQDLYKIGRTKIIIVTARPNSLMKLTQEELECHQIPFDGLIMGLPHCQRVVVNDFALSNPFPSCSAVNVERDADNLEDYLRRTV